MLHDVNTVHKAQRSCRNSLSEVVVMTLSNVFQRLSRITEAFDTETNIHNTFLTQKLFRGYLEHQMDEMPGNCETTEGSLCSLDAHTCTKRQTNRFSLAVLFKQSFYLLRSLCYC